MVLMEKGRQMYAEQNRTLNIEHIFIYMCENVYMMF